VQWTPERNDIGHTHARASSEQAWEPMTSSILHSTFYRKKRTVHVSSHTVPRLVARECWLIEREEDRTRLFTQTFAATQPHTFHILESCHRALTRPLAAHCVPTCTWFDGASFFTFGLCIPFVFGWNLQRQPVRGGANTRYECNDWITRMQELQAKQRREAQWHPRV
jgi:hypothetical protein